MRKVIEVIYNDLSSYVATNVIDWGVQAREEGDLVHFREASAPNKTTYIPIRAIKSFSVEEVKENG